MRRFCFFYCLLFFQSFLFSHLLKAALEVNVTEGTFKAQPLVIALKNRHPRAEYILKVLRNDLNSSGVFQVSQQASSAFSGNKKIDKAGLSRLREQTRADFFVNLSVHLDGDVCRVTCEFFDLLNLSVVDTFSLSSHVKHIRRIAHRLGDKIYQHVTGTPGYFETQVVYVAGVGKGRRRHFRLGLMDSDGKRHRYLRTFHSLLRMPYYDVKNKRIFYVRNKIRHRPQVFELDLYWDQEYPLDVGRSSVFSFRPIEGSHYLALTLYDCPSKRKGIGYSSVGLLNTSSGRFSQVVTPKPHIFISPTGSIQKKMLIFNSDHAGTPQLFVTSISGGGRLSKLSHGDGRYYSPMICPKNGKIAFMKRNKRGFNIGIMGIHGTNERTLSTFYWAESPAWSPSASAIFFVGSRSPRQNSQVYRIDMNSLKVVCLSTPDEAFDPSCSGF